MWDFYRKRYGGHDRFIFHVIGTNTLLPSFETSPLLIHMDDCMYSGKQLCQWIDADYINMIACPYISSNAKRRVDKIVDTLGRGIVLTTDSIPHDTSSMIDFELFQNAEIGTRPKSVRLSHLFDLQGDSLVTWVFEHKMADELSVPICMLNSPQYIDLVGDIQVKNISTQETISIHVRDAPLQKIKSLVYPCPNKNSWCDPCYKPLYKIHPLLVTQSIIDRTDLIFLPDEE